MRKLGLDIDLETQFFNGKSADAIVHDVMMVGLLNYQYITAELERLTRVMFKNTDNVLDA